MIVLLKRLIPSRLCYLVECQPVSCSTCTVVHKVMSHLGSIKKSSQISHANRLVGLIKYLLILISSVDSTGETRSAADMRFDLLDSSIQSAADLQQEGLNGRRGKGPQSKIFSVGSSLRRRSLQPLVGSMNGRSFSVRKGSSSE